MSKKNLSPKTTEGTKPLQKIIPIGQDVPAGGIEIQPSKTEMDELALKSAASAHKLHKYNKRPPVKIDLNELEQITAKATGDSRSSKTGDGKIPPPINIGPKGTVDKTYKLQRENINVKKK